MTEKRLNEHPALSVVRQQAKKLKKEGLSLTHMQILHVLAQKSGYKSWSDMVNKLENHG